MARAMAVHNLSQKWHSSIKCATARLCNLYLNSAFICFSYRKRGNFHGVKIFAVFMGTQMTSKIYLGLIPQNFWCSYILAAQIVMYIAS